MKRMCLKSEVLRDPLGLWPPLDLTCLPPLTSGVGVSPIYLPCRESQGREVRPREHTPMGESQAGGGEGGWAQHGWGLMAGGQFQNLCPAKWI